MANVTMIGTLSPLLQNKSKCLSIGVHSLALSFDTIADFALIVPIPLIAAHPRTTKSPESQKSKFPTVVVALRLMDGFRQNR